MKESYNRMLYSGVVYDTMYFDFGLRNFVLPMEIKPIYSLDRPTIGRAFTCQGSKVEREGDINDSVRIEMFDHFSEGIVQVISVGDDNCGVAHFGDISGKWARRFGAVGMVTDGFTRDAWYIERDEFPTFCAGVRPEDAYGKWQIVEYQVPVTIGDVLIKPDDYIFGDNDGVMVIPEQRFEEVYKRAYKRLSKEEWVRTSTFAVYGDGSPQELYEKCGRW